MMSLTQDWKNTFVNTAIAAALTLTSVNASATGGHGHGERPGFPEHHGGGSDVTINNGGPEIENTVQTTITGPETKINTVVAPDITNTNHVDTSAVAGANATVIDHSQTNVVVPVDAGDTIINQGDTFVGGPEIQVDTPVYVGGPEIQVDAPTNVDIPVTVNEAPTHVDVTTPVHVDAPTQVNVHEAPTNVDVPVTVNEAPTNVEVNTPVNVQGDGPVTNTSNQQATNTNITQFPKQRHNTPNLGGGVVINASPKDECGWALGGYVMGVAPGAGAGAGVSVTLPSGWVDPVTGKTVEQISEMKDDTQEKIDHISRMRSAGVCRYSNESAKGADHKRRLNEIKTQEASRVAGEGVSATFRANCTQQGSGAQLARMNVNIDCDKQFEQYNKYLFMPN